ncbi:hypothetical protein HAX54_049155 [Datura stramonium]|uniref:Uncharacterized protein n=1 Tax=Datura stramonium TaxID=4076 RepID=A0ABS8WNZ6_DATST|nr:hypothetical protein [Datura stramonium]
MAPLSRQASNHHRNPMPLMYDIETTPLQTSYTTERNSARKRGEKEAGRRYSAGANTVHWRTDSKWVWALLVETLKRPAEIDKCWWLPERSSEGGSLASPELKLLVREKKEGKKKKKKKKKKEKEKMEEKKRLCGADRCHIMHVPSKGRRVRKKLLESLKMLYLFLMRSFIKDPLQLFRGSSKRYCPLAWWLCSEILEQQKELILSGERVVLATLAFDLNVHHPYKPLSAIKKFKVAQNALAQVAWNFVNDGWLGEQRAGRTSLCLQFKPHHIAAGAIFLAAKFLKVKLPSDGEKVWWQEFDVTPRQLEEVSNQMLELYEQNRVPPQASEAEGSAGGNQRPAGKSSAYEEHAANNSNSLVEGANTSAGTSNPASSSEIPDQPRYWNQVEINDRQKHDREQVAYQGSAAEVQSRIQGMLLRAMLKMIRRGTLGKLNPRHKGIKGKVPW